MKCPFCGKDNTKVIDSRPTDDSSIRRRRQCDECGKRFTTYEKIESMPLIVIKKDNNREPYDRELRVLSDRAIKGLYLSHRLIIWLMRLRRRYLILERKKSQLKLLVRL